MNCLAGLGLVALLGMPAFSCTCVWAEMPPADYGASVVFRGQVTDRQSLATLPAMRDRRRYVITFRVDEYWKGSLHHSIILYGLDDGTDCMGGSSLEVGKNYLVFASQKPSEDVFLPGSKQLWFSWADVLPRGARALMFTECAPSGETSTLFVKAAIDRLGKGHLPDEAK
jgi:hypothetical protein